MTISTMLDVTKNIASKAWRLYLWRKNHLLIDCM